mgnify:CR=1 FL=1
MAESAETSAMAISTAACAGERVHVVALPPVPRPRKPARIVTLCANATPPHQAACKWRGPPLSGPLFHTPKYVLDSIVYSHIFTRCHVRTHEEATLHFIPYPAADLLSVDRADRVAYDAAVRKTLLDSVAPLSKILDWYGADFGADEAAAVGEAAQIIVVSAAPVSESSSSRVNFDSR